MGMNQTQTDVVFQEGSSQFENERLQVPILKVKFNF